MTVVVGMMTRDGMVLGADTEETSSVKRDIGKLPALRTGEGNFLVIGGAGPACHVDGITEQLWEAFGDADAYESQQVETSFRPIVQHYYDKHVLSWPSEAERLEYDFSLVIGYTLRLGDAGLHNLLLAEKGTLRRMRPYCAIGRGADYANILLDQFHARMSTVMASLVVIYILQKVKQHVPYCGKNSQVWCIRGIGHEQVPQSLVLESEESFKILERAMTLNLLRTLRAASESHPEAPHDNEGEFRALRQRFQPIAEQIEELLSSATEAVLSRPQNPENVRAALRKLADEK